VKVGALSPGARRVVSVKAGPFLFTGTLGSAPADLG
jgi:hypothetical protein